MTESDIQMRLARVAAAFNDKSGFKPEDFKAEARHHATGSAYHHDFSGGRSQANLDTDATSIINEIMGLRDRTKAWLKSQGGDPKTVDSFIKSHPALALVHDLANADKHGQAGYGSMSGHRPQIVKVSRAMTLQYDPATGTYATQGAWSGPGFNLETGEIVDAVATSNNLEVVLVGDINDENGVKVGELQKVLPDAIYQWERFLESQGLVLP